MEAGASSGQGGGGAGGALALTPAAGVQIASVTLPAVLQPAREPTLYLRCPHHEGRCPACQEPVLDGKPAASRLSPLLLASAPADLCGQLDELIRQAEKEGRRDLVVGGGQALFARLRALLPKAVLDPEPKKPTTFRGRWRAFWDALLGVKPPKTKTDPDAVLGRAMQQHWITQACLDRAKGLPLEGKAKAAPSREDLVRLAAFLPMLAEQIYADRRLPREG